MKKFIFGFYLGGAVLFTLAVTKSFGISLSTLAMGLSWPFVLIYSFWAVGQF